MRRSTPAWKVVVVALAAGLIAAACGSSSTVSGTVSALRGVAASASSLLGALSKHCPSASASPST